MKPSHSGLRRFPTAGDASSRNRPRWLATLRGFLGHSRVVFLAASVLLAAFLILMGPYPSLRGFATEPFRYRTWERPEWEVRARVPFSEEDVEATLRRRNQAAASVPPVFVVREGVLEQELDELLGAISALAEGHADHLPASLSPDLIEALRKQVADTAALQRVRDLLQAIREQLRQTGWLAGTVAAQHRFPRGELYVVGADGRRRLKRLEEVSAERVLGPGGPVQQEIEKKLADWPATARTALFFLVAASLRDVDTILQYSPRLTDALREEARHQTEPAVIEFETGSRLVGPGETITPELLELLRREHESFRVSVPLTQRLVRIAGVLLLVTAVAVSLAAYVIRLEPELWKRPNAVERLCVTLLVGLGLSILAYRWEFTAAPAVATAMILAIVYGQPFALVAALGLDLCVAWAVGYGLEETVVLAGGTTAAILTVGSVRNRRQMILAVTAVAATLFGLTWAVGLATGSPIQLLVHDSVRRLLAGLVAGALTHAALPLLERFYGVTTHITLLELCDAGHPLLRLLAHRAPGTYNHSAAVAVLAERAAEAIGADALLVRVGAFFHDVGKIRKPEYFIENNEQALLKHQQLEPAMSARIIIGHVKEGVELAREHKLPQVIIDFIQQHHGTTLVEYFYHEAAREVADDWDHRTEVDESLYRYPGPKPQTKEAAILMLADICESACRALESPTPAQIQDTVHRLVRKRVLDGQFDECNLTMREIRLIEQSLVKSLVSMRHQRVRYPSQQAATGAQPSEEKAEALATASTAKR